MPKYKLATSDRHQSTDSPPQQIRVSAFNFEGNIFNTYDLEHFLQKWVIIHEVMRP